MTSMRRSLPALDRVYSMLRQKIYNLHKPRMLDYKKRLSELNDKRAKEIIADIEQYAVRKYPELRIPLKCERAHSSVNSDSIQVGLYFDGDDSALALTLKGFVSQEEQSEADDFRILERWKMNAMMAMAAGEGFPPVGIAGLDEISSEEKYYG